MKRKVSDGQFELALPPTAHRLLPSQGLANTQALRELQQAFDFVRPDLNIERHADFIFAPSHSSNLDKVRERKWTVTLPDGRQVQASLTVMPYNKKIPTTRTRKVFLALQKLWEERESTEDGRAVFSTAELARILGLNWHGSTTQKQLRAELLQLRFTPLIWQWAYINESGQIQELLDTFTILDDFKLMSRKERKQVLPHLALNTFRFNENIRRNLIANRTKPTNLIALEISGEIALVLYSHLDIIMAERHHFERLSEGLFKDLHLEAERKYTLVSGRCQTLKRAIQELEGRPISTGILHLSLRKARGNKDWKLVVDKYPFHAADGQAGRLEVTGDASPAQAIPALVQDLGRTVGGLPRYQALYAKLFKTYPQDLVFQALSEYRSDGHKARQPIAFFLAILHRLVHLRGLLWIKPCDADCKFRPQEGLFG